jgi:flagellar FliJ protein
MKRFKFKLEKVLHWKQFKEDGVKTELAKVRGQINREVQKKEDFIAEERRIVKEMHDQRRFMNAQEVMNYDRYRSGLRHLVGSQDLIIADLRVTEKQVIAKYLEARKERRILDNLKEKKKVEHNDRLRKAERKEILEVALDGVIRESERMAVAQDEGAPRAVNQ